MPPGCENLNHSCRRSQSRLICSHRFLQHSGHLQAGEERSYPRSLACLVCLSDPPMTCISGSRKGMAGVTTPPPPPPSGPSPGWEPPRSHRPPPPSPADSIPSLGPHHALREPLAPAPSMYCAGLETLSPACIAQAPRPSTQDTLRKQPQHALRRPRGPARRMRC